MKIGIDCRTILGAEGERAGVAHYSFYLVKNLLALHTKDEFVLFFSHSATPPREYAEKNAVIRNFPKKIFPFFSSHIIFPQIIQRENLDVFHSLGGILPLGFRGKAVITVHDLSMYENPQWFKPKNDFFWRKILLPKSLRRAEKIIAVSEFTKQEILKYFKIPEEKIHVIYEANEAPKYSEEELREKARALNLLDKKYFLFIGTLEPRKNLENLIKAFEEFTARNSQYDYRLILAGGLGWKYQPILRAMKSSVVSKNIEYLGYIDEGVKFSLLRNAEALVFPSLYEGFGLPVLEAMSFGAPVIASNIPALAEVGGDAVLYFNPLSPPDIREKMENVAFDALLKKDLREKGLGRAKKFDWRTAAEKTLEVYRKSK